MKSAQITWGLADTMAARLKADAVGFPKPNRALKVWKDLRGVMHASEVVLMDDEFGDFSYVYASEYGSENQVLCRVDAAIVNGSRFVPTPEEASDVAQDDDALLGSVCCFSALVGSGLS